MISKDVKLIEYSKKVDFGNCLTHAVGAAGAVAALILMLIKAQGARHTASALIYGAALIAVYAVSAVYHGLKNGEAKRKARLVDHSTVPILIAGTATPCALITLYEISIGHCLLVFILGWACTLFGLFSKLFFFEKLKKVTYAVYIISGLVMLLSVIPILNQIDSDAFGGLILGNAFYLIGAAFCAWGVKRPYMHVVFHVLSLIGSAIHFAVIYFYVI